MPRLLAIEHVPQETIGVFDDFAREHGIEIETIRTHRNNPIPTSPDGIDGLIVMGGPMNVGDAILHPYLVDEVKFLRKALDARIPILGICLGAQLLAKAMRAAVYEGDAGPEIGWGPIRLTEAGTRDPIFRGFGLVSPIVLHWHGETFDLPEGAVLLAATDRYRNQAFRYGDRVYGLQFHVEVSAPMVVNWLNTFDDVPSPSRVAADTEQHAPALRVMAKVVFDGVFRTLLANEQP
ncbi:MAG: type 1 glutamine amidotransferase [Myxococcales bacterium]|nr:type 1 glutamine amidotransferase [Myxococcales bacterium]